MKLFGICIWLASACQLLLLSTVVAQTEDAAWKKLYEAGQRSFDQADYVEAERQLQASLKRAQAIESQPAIAESCEALARIYDEQEKFAQAEQHYRCLLVAKEKILGRDNYLLSDTLHQFSDFYTRNDKFSEAVQIDLQYLKLAEKNFGPDHGSVVGTLEVIGILYAMAGNEAEAKKYIELADARKARTEKKGAGISDGDDLLRQDANARKGMEAYAAGKIEEAEQHYKNALKLAEESGRRDQRLVVILEALAGNYRARQNPSASAEYYQRAVALREELLPWGTPELLPRLRMLSLRISSLADAYWSVDRENPATRERWFKDGVRELPQVEALFKKNIALWERAVGTESLEYAGALGQLKSYYLDRFAESYRELAERLQKQWKREGREPKISGQYPSNTFGALGERIEKVAGVELRGNPYFVRAMELWNRSLAIAEKHFKPDQHFVRGTMEEMARFFRSYGMEPERAAMERRIAAIDAAPKRQPAGDFGYLKESADELRKLGRDQEAAEIEARIKVMEAASSKPILKKVDAPAQKADQSETKPPQLCREMNLFALLGPVFTLPMWDQPEFRASGDRLLAGIRSRWGDRPLLEGKFGEVNLATGKVSVMKVADQGKLWEEATPLIRQPHEHNRRYTFAQNAKGETEIKELEPSPKGIAREVGGKARAEFTIHTEFAERKGLFEEYPTRYPRLSLLKLEIFDGEKKVGEQTFKNTRGDWASNFFALSPEGYLGFRSVGWLKVGDRRILVFDNLAEHDSLYGGNFVMCVMSRSVR